MMTVPAPFGPAKEVTAWLQRKARRRSGAALPLLSELAMARVQVNEVHCSVLMASASWQIAVELFEVCQRKMLQSDPFLCSAVINAYQRARRWHLAISGLELESINQVAYGAAISACQQADEWKVAERLFQDMLQLQMESNAQILSALMAGGAWKSSVNALSNVQVDPVLASAAISACNGGDRWLPGLAQLIFFRQHLVELNVYSYNSAMNGEGPPRWMAASSIFQRIEGELLQMNVVSYNSLISCYSQVSHWMLSLATALELRCSGLRLSEVSTAVSCSGCEKGRHWQMAFTLLSAWRSRFSIGSVVSACEKCSQWAEALSLLCGAQRSSHGGATAVNAAVSACEKSCRWRHALQLMGLPEMRCDIITWTAVATACAAAAWRVTLQMLVRMLHQSLVPQELACHAEVTALGSQNWQAAMVCYRNHQAQRLQPLAASLSTCLAAAERVAAAGTFPALA